ncbi:uncharacterized protein [Littorina saxatilis]|uniref:uncharacterized protein n=1 Tax=Littorina saxatilis TaxID=31220 RepID=UPI0038B695F9
MFLKALEPSEKENQRTSVREVFIKGTTTVATSIPWTATAAEVREVISVATKVPEKLLHVTVDGRTMTDDAALGMTEGSTLHYSVRGKGGMQKGDEAGGEEAGLDNQTNCLKKKEELFQAVKEEGNVYFGKGEFEKAVKFYTQCLSIFADRATVYTNRALCFLRLNQAVEAERDCTVALDLESTNTKALYRRGLARKMQENYRGAYEDQLKVLRSQPGEPSARREADLLKKLYKPEFRRTIQTGKHFTTNKEEDNSNSNRTKASLHETLNTPADVRKKTLPADATGQGKPSSAAATEQKRPSSSATKCEKTTVDAAEQEKTSAAATNCERPTMDDKKHERPTVKSAEHERLTVDATEQDKPSAEHKKTTIDAAEQEQPSAAATKHGKPSAEHERPTIDAAEQEQPSAAATKHKRPSATATEHERPSAAATEHERPSAATTEHERPSTAATEQERPSAAATEQERPSTAAKEHERPSTAATEQERPSAAATEHERPSAAATEQGQPSAAATNRERPIIDDPKNGRPSAATTDHTDKKNEHSKQDNMPKESNPNEVLASAAPKSARPRKRLTLVPPRKFKQDPKTCKYLKGQLDIHETADGFILPSTELKHYEREDTPLKEKFLLKSLKFVCGCMNSRRNGTIYFGVPEGDTQDQEFEYAEIVGVSLEEHERNEYYECFHRFLEKCFLKKSKVVKECVYGPYFVRIKTQQTESERFVIEVDVEPAADTCVENYFEFDPGHINKNLKEEKGVYLRGIEGGTVQTRRLPSDATEKYKEDLPAIVKKRKEEEKKWEGYMETRTNDAAKKLKAFMKECDESVDPVLLISKPTENVKADMDACLKFVKRIPWVAVLDFDYQSSEENGLLHLQTSSPSIKNVLPIPVKTFEKKKVEKQKVELNMSLQTLWFLANGSSGDCAFDHLEQKDWLKQYYPFVRNAVEFLQDPCVISKQRHHILILISAEMEEDIIRTADDMASDPDVGLDSAFFVFDEERTQELFISKSMFGEDIKTRSCTMPWQDVQRIVNAVLQFDRKHDHKQVITAGDTPC